MLTAQSKENLISALESALGIPPSFACKMQIEDESTNDFGFSSFFIQLFTQLPDLSSSPMFTLSVGSNFFVMALGVAPSDKIFRAELDEYTSSFEKLALGSSTSPDAPEILKVLEVLLDAFLFPETVLSVRRFLVP